MASFNKLISIRFSKASIDRIDEVVSKMRWYKRSDCMRNIVDHVLESASNDAIIQLCRHQWSRDAKYKVKIVFEDGSEL